uniref:Putative phd zn-finger n=1 Tax=Phlebotomus kandelakii TaxID=1109342 RepID=A0A6B2EFM2_9DIPT
MGGRKCVVSGCPSHSARKEDRGVTFHKFPHNPKVRIQWLTMCKMDTSLLPPKSMNVCSRHFRQVDFQTFKGTKCLLKIGAFPTIFPWGVTPNSSTEGEQKKSTSKEASAEKGDAALKAPATDNLKQKKSTAVKRSASVENVNKSPQKKILRKASDTAIVKEEKLSVSPAKKFDPVTCFTPGTRIEAQDFNNVWHSAMVMEVDNADREVLVHLEIKDPEKSTGIVDEWIPMDSSRLRPMQVKSEADKQKPLVTYTIGEKIHARWNDARKFRATVQQVLENNTYEILFDDGISKVVTTKEMWKIRPNVTNLFGKTRPRPKKRPKLGKVRIPSRYYRKKNSNENEWYCQWIDDRPVGREGFIESTTEAKKPSIIVDDPRLPEGWEKHIIARFAGVTKWDVVLVHPNGKKFRNKQELTLYLDETKEYTYDQNMFDFGIHKKRARLMKAYTLTDEYKAKFAEMAKAQQLAALEAKTLCKVDASVAAVVGEQIIGEGFVLVDGLKVQIIENLFRCPKEGCFKNFRKENLLKIHIKHYHEEIARQLTAPPTMTDLAYQRTVCQAIEEPFLEKSPRMVEKSLQDTPTVRPQRKCNTGSSGGKMGDVKVKIEGGYMRQGSDMQADIVKIEPESVLSKEMLSEEPRRKYSLLEEALNSKGPLDMGKDMKGLKSPLSEHSQDIEYSMDPEMHIKTHSVSRSQVLKRKKSHSRFRGVSSATGYRRNYVKRRMMMKNRMVLETMADSEETRHSFSADSSSMRPSLKKVFEDAHETTNSQTTTTEHSQSPQYINEGGELIKIVRMRQEEIINCLCSFSEEDGLMIQCELCLCWQHGICNGIEKESQVPDKYICYICRNPSRGRESMKYIHDQDWLYDGKLSTTQYHAQNPNLPDRFDTLKSSHTLTGNLLELKRFMQSLKLKVNIAENKDHPKMYLWSKKWESSPPPPLESSGSQGEAVKVEEVKKEGDVRKAKPESASPQKANNVQQPKIPEPEAAIDPKECQLRLLDHIQKMQSLAMMRLQTIDEEITALEEADKSFAHMESVDNCPKTKQTIRMLLGDLQILHQIAKIQG